MSLPSFCMVKRNLGCSPSKKIVAHEGVGWNPILKMLPNPGGDYWERGQLKTQ